jgi:hypothetical protein
MKLASTMFAGLLALNMFSTGALAGPRNGGKSGPVERSEVHAQKKKLRSVTAAAFTAQASADPKQLLAELQKTGLKITEVNTLAPTAIACIGVVLSTVHDISDGEIEGLRLRLKKGSQLIIRIGKVTAADSETTPSGQTAETPEEDDGE